VANFSTILHRVKRGKQFVKGRGEDCSAFKQKWTRKELGEKTVTCLALPSLSVQIRRIASRHRRGRAVRGSHRPEGIHSSSEEEPGAIGWNDGNGTESRNLFTSAGSADVESAGGQLRSMGREGGTGKSGRR